DGVVGVAGERVGGGQPARGAPVAEVQLGESRVVAPACLSQQLGIGECGGGHLQPVPGGTLGNPNPPIPCAVASVLCERRSKNFLLFSWFPRHEALAIPSLRGMSESPTTAGFPPPGWAGVSRLLSLVGRSECPPRPADELLAAWHEASGTTLAFAEW